MSFKQNRILMKTFAESQFEVIQVYKFQTKPNSYEKICWASVWSYVSWWVSNKSRFLWRHLLSLNLELFICMSFKQNRILKMTFVESQFWVMWVYKFQTKGNSCEDICSVSAWSSATFGVSSNNEFLWRHLLSFSLELCKFLSFKQKRNLIKTFVDSQFRVMWVYEFQTKGNSYEEICWGSVWSYVNLCVLNKSEFLWINLLSLSLKLCNFMKFKQKRFLMKTFIESKFQVL